MSLTDYQVGSINDKVHYTCGSINFRDYTSNDKEMLLRKLIDFAESYDKITNYYFIAHTETDTFHIHIAFYTFTQVMPSTIINKIADYMKLDSVAINCKKCNSLNAYLKYMLHKDKESIKLGKKQYDLEDIITSDTLASVNSMINMKKGGLDPWYLLEIVLNSHSDFEIQCKIGLSAFRTNYRIITDYKENRISYALMLEEQKKNERSDNLPW